MSTLTVKIEGLDQFKADVKKGVANIGTNVRWGMAQSVNAVRNTAVKTVPYKTGNLRNSIFTDIQDSGFTGIVGVDPNSAPYGIFIEYGTKAHTILPVNKKALYWKGALHPVRSVQHPGFAAKPFMAPALENNLEVIKNYFDQAILKIVHDLAGK